MEDLWVIDGSSKRRRAGLKICPICSNEFVDRLSYGKKIFCSIGCKNKSQEKSKIEFDCSWCNKKTIRLKCSLRAKSGIHFCSRECKNKAASIRDGIKEIHPSHYGIANNYRHLFDDLKCSRCGYCEFAIGIDVHHLDGNHANNGLNNLVLLCSPCHRALHNKLWNFATQV